MNLLRRMTLLFRERLEEALRPLGITAAQLKMLAALSEAPASSGAQVSRYCSVTPQSMHAILASAEKRGWVMRTPHPENAHTLLATLTPQGRRIFARGRSLALRLQKQMLRTLSAAELRALEETLAQLIANLE